LVHAANEPQMFRFGDLARPLHRARETSRAGRANA